MKLHDYFAGLLDSAVNINPDRLRQLGDHVAAIKGCLRDDDDLSPVVRSFVPQGSWAQRTIIKPLPGTEFDADLLVEMQRQRKWSKDPKQYLLAVHAVLRASLRYRHRVQLKTRCVRVTYANDCHVDLVPYVHLPGLYEGLYERASHREPGRELLRRGESARVLRVDAREGQPRERQLAQDDPAAEVPAGLQADVRCSRR